MLRDNKIKYFRDVRIGNDSESDYIHISKDEGVKLVGETTCWDDLRVSPSSLPLIGSRPPSFEVVGNDGTATTGNAFEFNGSSSLGEVAYYSDMDVTSLSIAVWLHPDSIGSMEIMDRDASGGFEFYVSNGRLTFSVDGTGTAATSVNSVVVGATQLAVVTIDTEGANSRVKLYLNGIKLVEEVENDTLNNTANGYIIGEYSSGGWNYDGVLDDIQVYNVILTDAQILEMYNDGTGITGLPTGITEASDLVLRFQNSLTNTATLGSGYNMSDTNISIVDGLIGVTSGSFGVATLAFYPDVISEIFFSAQLPHTYKQESDIYPHVHWMSPSGGSGDIVWGLEYKWVSVGAAATNTTITHRALECPTAGVHTATDIATLDGTGKTVSSMLMCRLFRDGTNALDTCTSKVFLSEFDFHFEINSFGSREIWVK